MFFFYLKKSVRRDSRGIKAFALKMANSGLIPGTTYGGREEDRKNRGRKDAGESSKEPFGCVPKGMTPKLKRKKKSSV